MNFKSIILVSLFAPALLAAQTADYRARVLVFSKTAGFRHTSIEPGRTAIVQLGREKGFSTDTTEDASVFNEENLKRYTCVIWLSTTGNVLDAQQQNAFERYIQAGGGYVGIHAASDTEYDWPWYGKLVGGWFDNHPSQPSNVQQGTFHITDKQHPLTSFLPEPWVRKDEFYAYKKMNPAIKVLITIDEKSYIGGTMGDYHPMSWYHDYDGGRAFYTNMGHTNETFSEPLFLQHLWAGLQWAMGGNTPKLPDYSKARTPVYPEENRFTKTVLDEKLDEPMELVVLPGKKILFIQRKGEVKLFDPAAGKTRTIATIPVSTKYLPDSTGTRPEAEDGLLGLTADPGFEKNHWIYLYYSAPGDEAKNILTRYELRGDELLQDTRKILLEVPVQRAECCHTGGSMAWDATGNLFLSTGDNSSPRADGFAPIDERPGRGPWDAQKSSSNTNDLRGKIIRIHPEPDGTYTVPDGNLFPKGMAKTRPEIYTMGHRNPYRIDVDKKTGFLYWGEVGPDANKPDEKRGPEGFDEVGQARRAGNFGWPYHIGDNKAYVDYDYATKQPGALYSVEKPLNHSPNNTGLTELPSAQKAFIWYPYAESKEFPLVGSGGRNAMAGPVFYSSDFKNAARAWPAYYDGKLIIYDWMRGWMMAVTMNAAGDYVSMEPVMPSYKFSNPMDMSFAPDGDLYMLEYGTGWFQANDDARLVRIEYNSGNRKPAVQIAADKPAGSLPLSVQFSSAGTKDYDGDKLTWQWVIAPKAGGKKQVFKTPDPVVVFKKPGVYTATLTVTDAKGASNSQSLEIVAGNQPPVLEFDLAGSNRTFFFPGKKIKYAVRVSDKEDGSLADGKIDPAQVAVNIDYLAEGYDKIAVAQGHRYADGNARFATALKIMDGTDCKACHKPAEKSIGPSFTEVALKYKDQAGAVELLAGRVIGGSTGVWGQVAMAAHPSLSANDAAEVIKYILSFSDEKAHPAPLPVQGEYVTAVPDDDKGVGAYLLRAAYKDRGVGALPGLSSEKTYILHNPNFGPHDFDDSKGVQKMTFSGNKFCIPSGNGSYIGFRQLDLSGVAQIQLTVNAPKQYNMTGGTAELRLDKPDGPLAGGPALAAASDQASFAGTPLKIPLLPGTGDLHDVYFVFRNDTAAVSQALFVVTSIVFQDETMASAPPPGPATAVDLNEYVGKYKFSGLPFEFMEVVVENGALVVTAGDQRGPVTALPGADKFDADGQATIEFIRENGKVTGMKLAPPGMSFTGVKQ
ncbi:MAG: ThuA domain-containing protein [Saprospiraceae bacterium]|nr:ThuA domain-containing protein [Saprospiraceae bacterium]